jgi:Polyketide cyclase / dehydrase and lipid transport
MVDVTRDGERYEVTVSDDSHAPPQAVYELLADLHSHMEWGGSWHPHRSQRLRSLHAPPGPATVGVEFSSEGTTPEGSWHDRSRVTRARRPVLFEFLTEGSFLDALDRPRMSLRAIHRYAVRAVGTGSRVTYHMTATLRLHEIRPGGNGTSEANGHHPRLPVVVFNLVVPSVIERGTCNLVRMAEALAAETASFDAARGAGLAGA